MQCCRDGVCRGYNFGLLVNNGDIYNEKKL